MLTSRFQNLVIRFLTELLRLELSKILLSPGQSNRWTQLQIDSEEFLKDVDMVIERQKQESKEGDPTEEPL